MVNDVAMLVFANQKLSVRDLSSQMITFHIHIYGEY